MRRSSQGYRLDGLEDGHRYRIDVVSGALKGVWWRWGKMEDMVVE